MKELFLLSLWITFLIIRSLSHFLHDRQNYGTFKENSKTLTRYLRKKTKKDIHHIHIGFILLLISVLLFIFEKVFLFAIFSGVGTSLVLDQILPLMKLGDYFGKKMVLAAILLHLIISIIILIV